MVKNPPGNAEYTRDANLTLGLGIFSGEGKGNLFQCSCLEKPMDKGAWRATGRAVGLCDPTVHRVTKKLT